jgi:hypothetical protein
LVTATGTGECRRYPPAHAFEPAGGHSRVSPVTGAYFWCGEHQPRDDDKPVPTGQDIHAAAFDLDSELKRKTDI